MEIDESELRTYNDGNPKPESTTVVQSSGDRDDRDWGAWKPRSTRNKPSTPTEERRVCAIFFFLNIFRHFYTL